MALCCCDYYSIKISQEKNGTLTRMTKQLHHQLAIMCDCEHVSALVYELKALRLVDWRSASHIRLWASGLLPDRGFELA